MLTIDQLRSKQDQGVSASVMSTLRMIEINPVEICNRACSFCPRSDPKLYYNKGQSMNKNTATNIARHLNDIEFDGRVGFVGFGEPLLHKKIESLISIIRDNVPKLKWLELNTNGDFLSREKIQKLADAGVDHLSVSMYDRDITDWLQKNSQGIDIKIVPRHNYKERFELTVTDRHNVTNKKGDIKNINRPCYWPFYQMFIDWNGNVLLCDNDWSKSQKFGNINQQTIKDIWLGEKFAKYRNILKSNRNISPCMKCNIIGTRYGQQSFDKFVSQL